jgi:hypothetical protein
MGAWSLKFNWNLDVGFWNFRLSSHSNIGLGKGIRLAKKSSVPEIIIANPLRK